MHKLISPRGGWEAELLRDDSDGESEQTLDEKLIGCSFIKEVREEKKYIAEIRYEEKIHNQLVFVEAVVFKENNDCNEENTLNDLKFFKRKCFGGDECKKDAAVYASKLKKEINSTYFSG